MKQTICKAGGCSNKYHAKGYCTTHYAVFIRPITPEYVSWSGAKQRCYYKSHNRYEKYGGRGIKMCERWKNSFECFLEDMGNKPTSEHSIERINLDGDYEPENCKWATRKEQARNKSNNRHITHNGTSLTLSEWAEITGMNSGTIGNRAKSGSVDIFKPVPKKGFCKRGHQYKGHNLYVSPGGQRKCRECRKTRRLYDPR